MIYFLFTLFLAVSSCSFESKETDSNMDQSKNAKENHNNIKENSNRNYNEQTNNIINADNNNYNWTITSIEQNAGLQCELGFNGQNIPVIVYFKDAGIKNDVCTQTSPPGPKQIYELRVAKYIDEQWQKETIIEVENTYGLSLAFDSSGNEAISFIGGENGSEWCGGSDLMLARYINGEYIITTVASSSNDSNAGYPESDMGDVVGVWSSLTFKGY